MIQINLLPEELRRARRASPKVIGLLFVASVISFGALSVTGFMWFNMRADRAGRVQIAQEQLDSLLPRARYSESLLKEKSEFEMRNKTISEIATSRIVWSRKLDRLSEIVNRDITQNRHRVWLNTLDINGKTDSSTAGVKIAGFSAGSEISGYTNFHEDLKTDPVFREGFGLFTAPAGKLDDPEKGVDPAEKCEFNFEVKLPVKDKKKAPAKAPPKAAPAPAEH